MSAEVSKLVKSHVKRGDEVEIVSGSQRGQKGKVLQVFPRKQRIVIEGLRMISKSTRRSQNNPKGGIEQREGSLHISNVRVVTKSKEVPAKKAAE